MPTTATPIVKPAALRVGDILPSGATVTVRPSIVQRGKTKGYVKVETGGGSLVLEPEVGLYVEREVPTEQERNDYLRASSLFHRLTRVVDALHDVNRATADLRSALADLDVHGVLYRASHGRSILRHYPADLESAAARYVALREAYAPDLKTLGVTDEQIVRWGADRLGSFVDDDSLYAHSPATPLNADCYLDGTPAVHPDGIGTRYTVAPLYPEVPAQ